MNIPNLLDREEFSRWMKQAENTLSSAKHDLTNGDYNWSCFKAHQAGEYSVKALTHYIPTRYPNAHPSKSPFQYYDRADATQAMDNANFLIQFVKKSWAELKKEGK